MMNHKTLLVSLGLVFLVGSISEAQLFRRGLKRRNANQSAQQRYQQQQSQQQQSQQQPTQRQQPSQQNLTRRQERIQQRQKGREQVEYQYLMDRRTGRIYYMPKKDYERWLADYKAAQQKENASSNQRQSTASRTATAPTNSSPKLLTTVPPVSTQTVAKPTALPPTSLEKGLVDESPMLELNPPSITVEPSAAGSDLIPLFDEPKSAPRKPTADQNNSPEVSVLERKKSDPVNDK